MPTGVSLSRPSTFSCLLTGLRGRILCATGYSLISEPGEPVNDVAEIIPEKTNVSFIPTDGSAELKLLVNGEPEQVDEVSR